MSQIVTRNRNYNLLYGDLRLGQFYQQQFTTNARKDMVEMGHTEICVLKVEQCDYACTSAIDQSEHFALFSILMSSATDQNDGAGAVTDCNFTFYRLI